MLVWKIDTKKKLEDRMIFSLNGGCLQVWFSIMSVLLGSSLTFVVAAIAGGPLVTIGLFIFAWTIYSHVHWIVPIIGSAFFGGG